MQISRISPLLGVLRSGEISTLSLPPQSVGDMLPPVTCSKKSPPFSMIGRMAASASLELSGCEGSCMKIHLVFRFGESLPFFGAMRAHLPGAAREDG